MVLRPDHQQCHRRRRPGPATQCRRSCQSQRSSPGAHPLTKPEAVEAASVPEVDPKAEAGAGVEILARAAMETIRTQPRTSAVVASHRPPSTERTRYQRPQRHERGSKAAPYATSVPQPWALDSQYLRIVHRPRGFPSPITSPEGFASGPLAEWLSHGHERGTPHSRASHIEQKIEET